MKPDGGVGVPELDTTCVVQSCQLCDPVTVAGFLAGITKKGRGLGPLGDSITGVGGESIRVWL